MYMYTVSLVALITSAALLIFDMSSSKRNLAQAPLQNESRIKVQTLDIDIPVDNEGQNKRLLSLPEPSEQQKESVPDKLDTSSQFKIPHKRAPEVGVDLNSVSIFFIPAHFVLTDISTLNTARVSF